MVIMRYRFDQEFGEADDPVAGALVVGLSWLADAIEVDKLSWRQRRLDVLVMVGLQLTEGWNACSYWQGGVRVLDPYRIY